MSQIENTIQKEIISILRFQKNGARYSQLKVTDVENDLFNYHLQQLVKNGFVVKKENIYSLTEVGKSIVTNIDEEDKKTPPSYKVSVYMCIVVNKQVLLYKRLKHPQYGYTGLPSGKIRYGEEIFQTAKRELFEETGLTAEFEIIGNLRQIRKNESGQVIEDGIFYVCFSDQVSGQIKINPKEGEFFWSDINDALEIPNIFKPSLGIVLSEVASRLLGKIPWANQFIYELQPEPENY